jgi:predicted secreted protein
MPYPMHRMQALTVTEVIVAVTIIMLAGIPIVTPPSLLVQLASATDVMTTTTTTVGDEGATRNDSTSPASTNATLSAKINEQFYITLGSNPTTGYEWQVAMVSNPDVVRFVNSEYIPPESQLLGAGGKQVLTFNALQGGNATIQLEYVRPWETGVPPISIYVAEVVIENGIQQ